VLRGEGMAVEIAAFDVTDYAAVGDAVGRLGVLDVLVNNAASSGGPVRGFPEATWHELMRTNLDSVFFVARRSRGDDRAEAWQDHQHLFGAERIGRPSIAPYAASKGREDATRHVRDWRSMAAVNGIGPGYFETELRGAGGLIRRFRTGCASGPGWAVGKVEDCGGGDFSGVFGLGFRERTDCLCGWWADSVV